MRCLVALCLLALAAPVLADDSGSPDPAFEPSAWEGKHSDELIAAWGKPTKTKRYKEDGEVLVYRLRFFGKEIVGETKVRWSDAGVGPSPGHTGDRERAIVYGPEVSFTGGPEVIATQKVKFYVDRRGVIRREEFGPRKWKKKP